MKQNSIPGNVIQLSDIAFLPNLDGGLMLKLTLRHFKGNTSATPTFLLIPTSNVPLFCPVLAISNFLKLRDSLPGPLFKWNNGQYVSRDHFAAILKLNLLAAGFDAGNYKSHSFHISACSFASSNGISDDQIMKMVFKQPRKNWPLPKHVTLFYLTTF